VAESTTATTGKTICAKKRHAYKSTNIVDKYTAGFETGKFFIVKTLFKVKSKK